VPNVECPREQDLLDVMAAGRWPERCDAELRAHVHDCAICTDLVEVVGALFDARDVVYADVPVPASGTVWWRAQLRARREATERAARPMTVVQGVAACLGLVALVGLYFLAAPWLGVSFAPFSGLMNFRFNELTLPGIDAVKQWAWPLAIIVGTWLVVAPIAIYLTAGKE
jgi:hypothetical protein